ncbi:MAG: DUF3597 domain-containing protein [Burkholderiales bacterium]|nr:DUF3597 domain-containing protein [Burkholderiales bacterium]
MSIFGTIMEKLGFMKKKAADAVLGSEAQAAEAPAPTSDAAPAPSQEPAVVEAAAVTETPNQEVDVVAVCEALAAKNPEKLNWKSSIVDLLKLLGLDSSLAHRKALAEELNCPKDLIGGDYSQMNVWLHKEVMKQLAENGGKVPDDLKN